MIRTFAKLLASVVLLATAHLSHQARAGVESSDISSMNDFAQNRLETARTGTSELWLNPRTGATGVMRIISTDDRTGRPPCRDYEWSITAASGETLEGRGQGCRISAGQWSLEETQLRRASKTAKTTPEKPAERKTPAALKEPAAPQEQPDPAEPEAATAEKDILSELTFTLPPRTFVALTRESSTK